jgi:hypothetical protein
MEADFKKLVSNPPVDGRDDHDYVRKVILEISLTEITSQKEDHSLTRNHLKKTLDSADKAFNKADDEFQAST